MMNRVTRRILRRPKAVVDRLRSENQALRAAFDSLALELRDLNATTTNDYRAMGDRLREEIDRSNGEREAQQQELRRWVSEYIDAVKDHLELHSNEAVAAATEAIQSRIRRLERAAAQAAAAPAAPVSAAPSAAPAEAGTTAAPPAPAQSPLGLDYSSFEDLLRGSPAHVRELERVHVETIEGFGAEGLPVLDVGCGRGEFLQLLTEAGIPNRGIDLNPVSVEECVEAGLDVVGGDAVAYLQSLEPGSLRAVCGFHIVEHMTDQERTSLLIAAHRAIAPGGGIIFETPNPENLRVGATNFWLDPTHLRPIPPQLLRFQAEQAGFDDVTIQRLHPSEEAIAVGPDDDPRLVEVATFVNGLVAGPLDYAVVGRVSAAAST